MTDATWTRTIEGERIGSFEPRVLTTRPMPVPGQRWPTPGHGWREVLEAGPDALDVLGSVVRRGVGGSARVTIEATATARSHAAQAHRSARTALLDAPGRLRDGAWRAIRASGFAPLYLLLSRYPSLALALGVPVLIASLFLAFWSGVSAVLLGLWCVTTSLIFANQAAHQMLRDAAGSTSLSTKEMPT